MFTKFEHFAATTLMSDPSNAPPRQNGHLSFERDWEKTAFAMAIALSKKGHYEWDEFRQMLMATIHEWESTHALDDPEWDYYQCWMAALEKLAIATGVISEAELEAQMEPLLSCKGNSNPNS